MAEGAGWKETEYLTADEHQALRLTAELAGICARIVGEGPVAGGDWNELAMRIHAIQHTIMAQAAARAYPEEFRLLGSQIHAQP